MIKPVDIAELKRLLAEAPWPLSDFAKFDMTKSLEPYRAASEALFSAAPSLLDELERLRERCAKLEAQLQGMSDHFGVGMTEQIRERWERERRETMARAIRFAGGNMLLSPNVSARLLELADCVESGDMKIPE